MRYLHPLAGCSSIAARRQPLADASAAVFPSPLFLVASTTQPYGTPAPQDRPPPPPPPPSLPARLPPCLSPPACVPACPPSAAVSLAWGVLDGAWGLVWGFLSWRGGPLGWIGRRAHGVGVAPYGSLTLWPWPPRFCGHAPRVFLVCALFVIMYLVLTPFPIRASSLGASARPVRMSRGCSSGWRLALSKLAASTAAASRRIRRFPSCIATLSTGSWLPLAKHCRGFCSHACDLPIRIATPRSAQSGPCGT